MTTTTTTKPATPTAADIEGIYEAVNALGGTGMPENWGRELDAVLDQIERFRVPTEQTRWCDDYANVLTLGDWLVNEHCLTAAQLQSYYEKPWKWEKEFRLMEALSGKTVDVVCPYCQSLDTVDRGDVDSDGECFDRCRCGDGWPRVEIDE